MMEKREDRFWWLEWKTTSTPTPPSFPPNQTMENYHFPASPFSPNQTEKFKQIRSGELIT